MGAHGPRGGDAPPAVFDEPFGLIAAEAQTAGCPVVGHARGALPEIASPDAGDLGAMIDAHGELLGEVATGVVRASAAA